MCLDNFLDILFNNFLLMPFILSVLFTAFFSHAQSVDFLCAAQPTLRSAPLVSELATLSPIENVRYFYIQAFYILSHCKPLLAIGNVHSINCWLPNTCNCDDLEFSFTRFKLTFMNSWRRRAEESRKFIRCFCA